MSVDANGNSYVPDSEDEESGMEVEMQAGGVLVADLGGGGGGSVAADAIVVEADGVVAGCVDVAAEGVLVDAIEVVGTEGTIDGTKVAADMATSEEMHPEVAARLNTLLAGMDPTFHDVFVSMYKGHVQNRRLGIHLQEKLKRINIEVYSLHNNMFTLLEKKGLSFLERMDFILF